MNAASLVQAVTDRCRDAVKASHTYRGDATVVVSRESLLEVARILKEEPAFQMNFLMDLTAVDYSAFGTKASPAFFASSGVAVRPSPGIPDQDPWPGPPLAPSGASAAPGAPGAARFVGVIAAFRDIRNAQWRVVLPAPLKKDDVTLSVERARVLFALAK